MTELSVHSAAVELGLDPAEILASVPGVLKVPVSVVRSRTDNSAQRGRLVLVTAMNPTPFGEGKTVVAIGLAMGLRRIGRRSVVILRQPSLGPVFGVKGGAAGGGRATVEPYATINLGLNGDIEAVGAAHNLLSAMIDNHLFHGNAREIDPERILWPRAVDVEDRSLRSIRVSSGKPGEPPSRPSRYVITAASEVMAVLGLSRDYVDLKARLGRIVVALDVRGEPVTARQVGAAGSMAVLLRQALAPNLVTTAEGGPALIHGGPFANIAHGTASRLAIELGLATAEYSVVEAGFSSELGAEKFVDLVGPMCGFQPNVAVLVASVRALRHHGGAAREVLDRPDPGAVGLGLPNLEQHLANLSALHLAVVVAINRFPDDSDEEIAIVTAYLDARSIPWAETTGFRDGGSGAEALARRVELTSNDPPTARPIYSPTDPLERKVERIATTLYGALGAEFTPAARTNLEELAARGDPSASVCMAKTPLSLSDDPTRRGRPKEFRIRVDRVEWSAGAGFWVVRLGTINTMPGLPAHPLAESIDLTEDGRVVGLR
ncbi:MAG: formate--tetrahydrofolate ligase [Thermoplasmata archaeon]|nr:formate--tetrahydrofolate ligase [Thermoplasmata archaeon]